MLVDFYIYGKKRSLVMLKRMCYVVAASVLTMNGVAMGAVVGDVFTEDFESETSGTANFPTPTSGSAPYWIDHSSYWTGTGHQAAPFVGETGVGGNAGKYYYVHTAADANTASTQYGAISAWKFAGAGDAHPEIMKLNFDMFVREYSVDKGPRLSLVDHGAGFYRAVGVSWAIAGSANPGIRIYDPSGANDVFVADAVSEQWQSYELIVNTITKTVSLSVDGATAVTTTYTPNSGGPFDGTPDALEIYGIVKHTDWYAIDNLRLEVTPEPASLALMGLGGLILLSRRRS
jgi:hypothetical protein